MKTTSAPVKKETRDRLLSIGIQLFQKQGYHATGLKDLVEATGIPKGSFYYYFDSKEQFVAEVILEYIGPFLRKLDHIHRDAEVSVFDQFKGYFESLILEFESDTTVGGCLLGNMLGEIGDTSEAALNAMDSAVTAYRAGLRRIIRLAQQEGTVRKDVNAEVLANLIFDAWQGALLRLRVDRSTRPLRQFVDSTFHYLLIR